MSTFEVQLIHRLDTTRAIVIVNTSLNLKYTVKVIGYPKEPGEAISEETDRDNWTKADAEASLLAKTLNCRVERYTETVTLMKV